MEKRKTRIRFCTMCPHPLTPLETKAPAGRNGSYFIWMCGCCDGAGMCPAKEKAK